MRQAYSSCWLRQHPLHPLRPYPLHPLHHHWRRLDLLTHSLLLCRSVYFDSPLIPIPKCSSTPSAPPSAPPSSRPRVLPPSLVSMASTLNRPRQTLSFVHRLCPSAISRLSFRPRLITCDRPSAHRIAPGARRAVQKRIRRRRRDWTTDADGHGQDMHTEISQGHY